MFKCLKAHKLNCTLPAAEAHCLAVWPDLRDLDFDRTWAVVELKYVKWGSEMSWYQMRALPVTEADG